MNTNTQSGSAIIMLFVAVALFGMISYVVLQGSRGNTNMIKSEASKAAATGLQDCTNAVTMATKRLTARGCGTLISMEPDGSPTAGGAADGSCSVFHPNGGGVKQCGTYTNECMRALAIGETCNGVVYAGTSGGNRIYTAMADEPAKMTYNNGNDPVQSAGVAFSMTDGVANTDLLVNDTGPDAPYRAALACRAKGPKWYLPSRDELQVMYDNRNTGAFAGTYNVTTNSAGIHSRYWASSNHSSTNAYRMVFGTGTMAGNGRFQEMLVRCVRRD